jgi:hypothetical protein
MTRENFTCKVVSELLKDKFSILIYQTADVKNCGGYFDYSGKEFVVALKNRKGFEIMIHEYCHFLQWKENRKYFLKLIKDCGILFDWLDGKFYKKKIINEAVRGVIELEWDCEKRAIELIKKYKLDVDIEEYSQSANCYLLFYHIVRKYRKWYKNAPYNTKLNEGMLNSIQELDYYLDFDNITEKQHKQYLKIIEK